MEDPNALEGDNREMGKIYRQIWSKSLLTLTQSIPS